LEVIAAHPDDFELVGLAAGKNADLLEKQARDTAVRHVAIADESRGQDLAGHVGRTAKVYIGAGGLVELVRTVDVDFVLAAIVGAAGLPATLTALDRGLTVGLANKESLVVAGALATALAAKRGATLLPV